MNGEGRRIARPNSSRLERLVSKKKRMKKKAIMQQERRSLVKPAIPSPGGILAPGKYNGIVIFDRWGACHRYTGSFQM